MARLFPAAMLLSAASMLAQQPSARTGHLGSVNGTVTDEEGRAVAGATVYADPMDAVMIGIVPQNQTDAAGRFAIGRLLWGRYRISAAKEEESYPAMLSEFFTRNHPPQTVTLGPENPTVTVSIRMGPKAGKLTGTATDAVTSAPLNTCADFRWASDPRNFLTGTGLVTAKFGVLIPSSTDVLWTVWQDGYKPWYYPGTTDESAATSVRLEPGQVKTVAIELQPDAAAVYAGCGMPVGTVIKP
jgi:hypothetical protein